MSSMRISSLCTLLIPSIVAILGFLVVPSAWWVGGLVYAQQQQDIAWVRQVTLDQEFIDAHRWMVDQGMTKYVLIKEYDPHAQVTREQAAKFFSVFSKEVLYEVLDMWKYCSFDDLDQADKTLKNSILEACLLNLFQWSAWKFYPHRSLSKAEALTVLVRALDGYRTETGPIWREQYHQTAYDWWLTKVTDKTTMENKVTRYEIALLLYRANAIHLMLQEERLSESE